MARFLALAVFLLLLGGCASRHISTYRYLVNANKPILIPPGAKNSSVAKRTIPFPAGHGANRTCAVSENGVDVKLRGQRLRVTIHKAQILQRPPGQLAMWAASYEQSGCVEPGQGLPLATRIAESLPLDPVAFHTLLHADPLRGGYVDLGPESRLRVVSPIRRTLSSDELFEVTKIGGDDHSVTVAVKPTSDFLGYETAWYKLEPKSGGIGLRFQFVSAEARLGEKVTPESRPRTGYFAFDPSAAYFRLFFLTRISAADHDIAILGAPTAADLDAMTPGLQQNPAACKGCVMIPKDVAIVPHLAVTVNGKEVAVPAGTPVAAAIRAGGEPHPERLLASLQIQRPYATGLIPMTFDRTRTDVLGLLLRGGEDLRW